MKAFSRTRTRSNLISIHMKTILIVVIGVLLWQSTDARQFTSNILEGASEFIEPDSNREETIGEKIDSFFE